MQVIQEIQDDEAMDLAAAVNPSSGSEDAPLPESASLVKVSSEVATAFPGSTRGGRINFSTCAGLPARRPDGTNSTDRRIFCR